MGKYRRVMLKLSGEALAGEKHTGFDLATVQTVAEEVRKAADEGIEIAIVIGGGNFWRGRTGNEIARVKSDQIGMLATVMNSLYVSEVFRTAGMKTAIFGALEIPGVMPLFDIDEVEKAFAEGKIVFFAAGTGHPYFSTDSGTLLRAIEIQADIVLLAKAIDGVYSADPRKDPDAVKFDTISIEEVVDKHLQVIDMTASVLCMENKIPLAVFSLNKPGNIADALNGKIDGTIVTA